MLESEALAQQQMIEANLGLEAEEAGMDELSRAYRQLQEVLQRHGEETEEEIDAIEKAWEAFEIAQQEAEDALAQAEEEGSLLEDVSDKQDESSSLASKKKSKIRREVSWEDSLISSESVL